MFSLTLLLFVIKSFGQTEANRTVSKDYYLKKSKNQKTVAWVMLGGGVAMTTIGLVIGSNVEPTFADPFGLDKSTGPAIVAAVGAGVALGSIPFFISSAKNKRRAAAISFNNQKILFPLQKILVLKTQPAVTLKIEL